MKKISYLSLLFLLFCLNSYTQILDPVKWETSVKKISETEFDLISTATIEDGWHLYSQNIDENGPVPTSFSFKDAGNKFILIGKPSEDKGHTEFDKIFEMDIKYFEKKAQFKQRIKLLSKDPFIIDGSVEYMACDDTQCLAPEEKELNFSVSARPGSIVSNDKVDNTAKDLVQADSSVIQQTALFSLDSTDQNAGKNDTISGTGNTLSNKDEVGKQEHQRGLWNIFIIAFLSGFAALLTPCVFPMIPMTVSFFTKQSKNKAAGIKNAVIYGLSIIGIYVLLGSLVTGIYGADSLNALSTNVWFNVIFFLLLVIFALSFFGAFELVLPSSWSTKIDAQADRGGIIGIIFMALALAIVSFSCTGPIVGTLLVEAASKGGTAPIIGMFGFSLAIALPFALFAAFPGWMNSLPKSGGWLNTVKVSLGFIELALAFKFLSNADLVSQAHYLERELFLSIWITIAVTFALYLFGLIKLPHDSVTEKISVGRLSLGMLVLMFAFYLLPGLWGAPLKIISGFPPPKHYSESPHGIGNQETGLSNLPEGAVYGPHNIVTFLDYDKGMAYAKNINKPVMLDFTGHACVNCRKMEERVWSDDQVLKVLKNDIVLISLYVDEKKELPEKEQYISETTGKKISTVGNKWSDFQIKKYRANAQPYYVLIDHKGNNLNEYSAYDPDVASYYNWLMQGIANFK